ncbi:MAG TPA: hypothetical protein VNQ52_10010 [Microbacteriaceae bacterium]|nr:hypothetical protein [Microbacteriaceae bacterium]
MNAMRRAAALLAGGASLLALAGCSQIAAIAPVGGDRLAEVRYAAIDVLLAKDVPIRTAPVCEQSGQAVSCTGETLSGEPIAVASTASDPETISILVGDTTIFTGSIADVLADAMEAAG